MSQSIQEVWLGILTIVVIALIAALVYAVRTARRGATASEKSNGIPWRKNVLLLLALAYLSLSGLFVGMALFGVDAKEAYDKISVPFVALIGGTLAVAKDLIE